MNQRHQDTKTPGHQNFVSRISHLASRILQFIECIFHEIRFTRYASRILVLSLAFLCFYVAPSNASFIPGVRMSGDNIGIGTTAPQATLHVGSTGTPGSIDGPNDLYVLGSMEVDGTIFGAFSLSGDLEVGTNSIDGDASAGLHFDPDNDGTNEIKFQADANVGVGTTTPAERLHVYSGALSTEGNMVIQHDTYVANRYTGLSFRLGANPSKSAILFNARGAVGNGLGDLTFLVDSNNDASDLVVGDEKMRITSDGNVGIGITAPLRQMHILGTNSYFRADGSSNSGLEIYESGSRRWLIDNVVTTDSLRFNSDTGERMTITQAGNVGIGTTAPGRKVDVTISARTSTFDANDEDTWHDLRLSNPTDTFNAATGIGFNIDGSSSQAGAGIAALKNHATNQAANLAFITRAIGGNLIERMRIDTSGNVGIGITAPTAGLEIVQSGGYGIIMANNNTDSTTKASSIGTRHYTNAEESALAIRGSNSSGVNAVTIGGGSSLWNAATQIDLYTAANSTTVTGTSRMTINSSGNVGIGTTGPLEFLHVYAAVDPDVIFEATGTGSVVHQYFDTGASSSGGDGGGEIRWREASDGLRASILVRRIAPSGDWPMEFWTAASDGAATEKVHIQGDGNVGIGTSVPTSLLDVVGGAALAEFERTSGGDAIVAILANNGDPQISFDEVTGGTVYAIGLDDSNNSFNVVAASQLGSAERLVVKGSNVGVGGTGPLATLHVGSTGTPGSVDGPNDLYVLGSLEVDGTIFGSFTPAGDLEMALNSIDGDASGGLHFDPDNDGTNEIKFQADGNVGIGITTPTARLNLDAASGNILLLEQSTTDRFTFGATGAMNIIANTSGTVFGMSNAGAGDFVNVDSGKFVVKNGGNVGIGTSVPDTRLHVMTSAVTGAAASGIATLTVEKADNTSISILTRNSDSGRIEFGDPEDADDGFIEYSHPLRAMNFQVANSIQVSINSSGNLGIGSTNPGAELVVVQGAGTIPALDGATGAVFQNNDATGRESRVVILSGDTGVGTLAFGDDSDEDRAYLKYFQGTDLMRFGTAAGDRMFINGSGNLGVGTSAPVALLEVNGNIALGSRGDNSTNAIGKDNAAGDVSGNTSFIAFESTVVEDDIVFGTHFSGVGGGERMRIDAGGNVGIGSSAPSDKFTVSIGGTASGGITLLDSDGVTIARLQDANTTSENGLLQLLSANSTTIQLHAGGFSYFNGGNVGVGTTGPTSNIHVLTNTAGSLDAHANADELTLENNAQSGLTILHGDGHAGNIYFGTTSGGNQRGYISYNGVSDAPADQFFFGTAGGDRMVINASGNVGIGTTAPGQKLSVDGDLEFVGAQTIRTTTSTLTLEPNSGGGTTVVFQDAAPGMDINPGFNLSAGPEEVGGLLISSFTSSTTGAGDKHLVRFDQMTLSRSGAATMTNAATLKIVDAPVAAGDLTITNPYALWVDAGNSRFDGNIQATASNVVVSNGGSAFGSSIYSPQPNEFGISTNSTDAIRITSAQNVGIGTTAPSSLLHITTADFDTLEMEAQRPTAFFKETDGSADQNFQIRLESGVLRFQQQNDAQSNAQDRMVILQDGNVGIGISTPSSILDIDKGTGFGQVTINGSSGGCLMIRDTDDAGWTECSALDGTLTCTTDADGICDGS